MILKNQCASATAAFANVFSAAVFFFTLKKATSGITRIKNMQSLVQNDENRIYNDILDDDNQF